MKKIACMVIFIFFISVLPQYAQVPGEPEGKKLGTIISTVIGIVLPQVSPLINMIFPKPNTQPNDTAKISKKDLENKLKQVKADMQKQIQSSLNPLVRIISEVDVLSNVLKPCIEIQDYLREIIVLIAEFPIIENHWKRVQEIWPQITKRINTLSTDKGCDVAPIRNRDVKTDLGKITGLGKTQTIERLEMDFIKLNVTAINDGDKATILRIKMSALLELFQTVQYILDLSLKEFREDFAGALTTLTGENAATRFDKQLLKSEASQYIDKRLEDVLNKINKK